VNHKGRILIEGPKKGVSKGGIAIRSLRSLRVKRKELSVRGNLGKRRGTQYFLVFEGLPLQIQPLSGKRGESPHEFLSLEISLYYLKGIAEGRAFP